MMLHTKYFFRQESFESFFPIYVKQVTHRVGSFWPQGYNLNKLGRGPLDDATYQISFRQTSDPWGGVNFDPRALI